MGTEVVDEPVVEEVAETVAEPTSAEAEAELASGFGDEPGEVTTEPTGESLPVAEIIDPLESTPEPVAESVAVEPEFVQFTKAERQQMFDDAAAIRAALGQLEGKAFGKMGELQRTLKQIQETPRGQAVDVSAEDFKELADNFPEVAEMVIAGVKRASTKAATAPAVDADAIRASIREELALDILDADVEGWRDTVNSDEYKGWLGAQPADYQALMNSTEKPSDIKRSLKSFAAAQAAKPKPKAPAADPAALRRQRMEAAVVAPSAGGGGPQGKTATDHFLDGFNS